MGCLIQKNDVVLIYVYELCPFAFPGSIGDLHSDAALFMRFDVRVCFYFCDWRL